MLAYKAAPSAAISTAQKGKTGHKPRNTKNKAKLNENRQVAPKKSFAAAGVSEQLGAKSMRCSMARRIT
jgi:hypothetical protein